MTTCPYHIFMERALFQLQSRPTRKLISIKIMKKG
jgi:hypothetical protein